MDNIYYRLKIQFNRQPIFIGIDNKVTLDGQHSYDKNTDEANKLLKKAFVYVNYLTRDCNLPAKDLHDQFHKYAKEIYEATDKKIDMLQTGTPVNTALHFFLHSDVVQNLETEPISMDEFDLIEHANKSDLIWSTEYTGQLFKYDFKSLYPHLMITNKFPIKEGSFKTFDKLPDILPYGFYRCLLKSSHWSFDKQRGKEWITHIDINNSLELKKKVQLVCDGEPNAYIYDEDSLYDGSVVFKEFVDYFFALKDKKIFFGKSILNSLWGALCQKNAKKLTINIEDYDEYNDKWIVHKLTYRNDGKTIDMIKLPKHGQPFCFPFARMKPFIKAMSCAKVRARFWEQKDNIVRIHTDGSYMNTYCKGSFKVKTPLGGLRYEGRCENGFVKNIMECTKEDEFSFPFAKKK